MLIKILCDKTERNCFSGDWVPQERTTTTWRSHWDFGPSCEKVTQKPKNQRQTTNVSPVFSHIAKVSLSHLVLRKTWIFYLEM